MSGLDVLDLFSGAAGGWSLGLHRAGFRTVAACESVAWRRAMYAVNNPDARLYDDVCTLTADRLLADLGSLPRVVVGSPPCQDISSANTKGKGVDGERSGLFFEATRIIGEVRPRWFALENSARLRTKGSDRVLDSLASRGYACWPLVVRAEDVRANHERPRVWILGCDLEQVADPDGVRCYAGWQGRRLGLDLSLQNDLEHASGVGRDGGRPRGHGPDGDGASPASFGASAHARGAGSPIWQGKRGNLGTAAGATAERDAGTGARPHSDNEAEPGVAEHDEMGGRTRFGGDAAGPWAEWNGGLAHHLRVDDGLSAWVAQSRVAIGGPRGTAAANLLVEAFGDAVVPQITEVIGRAILRTEAALAAIYDRRAA